MFLEDEGLLTYAFPRRAWERERDSGGFRGDHDGAVVEGIGGGVGGVGGLGFLVKNTCSLD